MPVREECRGSAAGCGVHRGAEGGETGRSPLGFVNSPSAKHEGGLRPQLGVWMMSRLGHRILLSPPDLTHAPDIFLFSTGMLDSSISAKMVPAHFSTTQRTATIYF
ncbi:hypothetical protein QQF64_014058 [Cirrhinus molitorella]|uniref:Uncharacterized protein n=1 Tax=Cirrhinus molitorella TaxID=172907 RepID=A0ABR3LSW5_9TELE